MSLKREGLLKTLISTDEPESRKKKPLLDLCKTRWTARQDAYDHFAAVFPHIIVTLEVIVHGLHRDCNYDPLLLDGWSTDCKRRAASLLSTLTKFGFMHVMVAFTTTHRWLSHLAGSTVRLQGKAI